MSDADARCPHCGERLMPIQRRPGCVCDLTEWRNPENVPPICENFEPDLVGGNCVHCEHDRECHASPSSNGGLNRRDGSVADGTSALKPLLGEDGGE